MKAIYKSKENIILYLVILISAIGLIGWKTGELLFARISVLYIPIAPSTAYSFIISCLALILFLRVKNNIYIKYLSQGLITLVILTVSIILLRFFVGYGLDLENIFIKNPEQFKNIPIGRMSPLTAGLFLLNGFAILILPYTNETNKILRKFIGVLLLLGFAISVILLIGYLYNAPLLYGGNIIPVAFPTSICFFLLSVVLLLVIKFNLSFFLPLASSSAKILLKSFIPFVIVLIIIIGYFNSVINLRFNNPALFSALLIIIFIPVTILLIYSISRSLGSKIEKAEKAMSKNEEILKQSQLLLKSSLESPKNMIILSIDQKYQYLFFNKAHKDGMKNVYNIDVEIGMNVLDCITSEADRKSIKFNYDRSLSGESHTTIEELGDKYISFYESFFNPIYNEKNEIIGMTVFARDITERKTIEIELKKYRDNLETQVNERTAKLEKMNEDLIEKNSALEKYNQLFVDREFRIKELKGQIKQLKSKT